MLLGVNEGLYVIPALLDYCSEDRSLCTLQLNADGVVSRWNLSGQRVVWWHFEEMRLLFV